MEGGFQERIEKRFISQPRMKGDEFALGLLAQVASDGKKGSSVGRDKELMRIDEFVVERKQVVQTLKGAISSLEGQLHREAVHQHEQLLGRVHDLKDLHNIMHSLTAAVERIDRSLREVKLSVVSVYDQAKFQTNQLERIYKAIRLIQHVLTFLTNFKKLETLAKSAFSSSDQNEKKGQQVSLHDYPKMATYLQALCEVRKESKGVDHVVVVREQIPFVEKTKDLLVQNSTELLMTGMKELNQSKVAYAIQVFFSLRMLLPKLREAISPLGRSVSVALEKKQIPQGRADNKKGGKKEDEEEKEKEKHEDVKRWLSSFSDVLREEVIDLAEQAWHIYGVLRRTRDPSSQGFIEEELQIIQQQNLSDDSSEQSKYVSPSQMFWNLMCDSIKKRIYHSLRNSSSLQSSLHLYYPHLLKVIGVFMDQLMSRPTISTCLGADGPHSAKKRQLLQSLSQVKDLYERRMQDRLLRATQSCFADPTVPPSRDNVSSFIQIIDEETAVLHLPPQMFDVDVTAALGNSISQCSKIFVKYMTKILENPSSGSALSISALSLAFNGLQKLHETVSRVKLEVQKCLPKSISPNQGANTRSSTLLYDQSRPQQTEETRTDLPEEEAVMISLHSALNGLQQAADMIAVPLCSPVYHQFCNILNGMNSEDFGGDRPVAEHTPSQYMEKINTLFQTFAQNLSYFGKGELLDVHLDNLVTNMVSKFILQACLLSHLSSQGVLRLTKDMAQFELSLGSFRQLKLTGKPYQQLRGFRQLLFRELSEISKCEEAKILPARFVLHHLFSLAPKGSIISPIQYKRCTQQQYMKWLEEADDAQVWKLCQECLAEYVKKVNAQGQKEFCSVYPLLVSFGDWGLRMK